MSEHIAMPEVAPPVWDNIPADLAALPQWLVWKFEPPKVGGKKWQKVPYYVSGGRRAGGQGSDHDRHRLTVLSVVRRAFEAGGWSGVGFGFLPGDGMVGIDIDDAIDDEGVVSARCMGIVGSCPGTLIEYSPSGRGCHIIGLATTHTAKFDGIGVEVYAGSQYFTVTGRLWPGSPAALGPILPMVVDGLHAMIQRAKDESKAAKQAAARPSGPAPARRQISGEDMFARVNAEAMQSLAAWVPQLIPVARPYHDGYRATSKDLGRNLQEDLSILPKGIMDFGLERGFTPIDLVIEWLPAASPKDALTWLAQRLGIELATSRREPKPSRATAPAAAGGAAESGGGGGDDEPPPNSRQAREDDAPGPSLVRHRGKPVDCRENVLYCLRDDAQLAGLVRWNAFTELHERSRTTQWGREPGEWDEEDDMMLGELLLREHGLMIKAISSLRQGVLMAAREHRYNPIVDLIKSQAWDGTDRLDHWIADVFETRDRPYTRLIGRCFIMGMVMRAMRPGCKFDYMFILKGEQGLKKSAVFRALAEPWFTDNAIKMGDKDSLMTMQLVWIAESAELESLNKAETTAVKQFLSAQDDMYRPPYGAQIKKRPRHTVIGGSTNADTFLKDATGDRRFWPLEVDAVHLERLRDMRLQLFAEALHRLKAGEQYWPTKEQEHELIFPEQERFKKEERWEDYLNAYVNCPDDDLKDPLGLPRAKRDFFPTTELYDRALQIKADRIDGNGQMDTRVANAMKALGFIKHRLSNGLRTRGWKRAAPEEQPAPQAATSAATQGAEDDDLPL